LAKSGIAPASAPERRSSRNCGRQPVAAAGAAALEQGGENSCRHEGLLAGEGVPFVAVDVGERIDDAQALQAHRRIRIQSAFARQEPEGNRQ
jgi:hypothetical protein